MQGMLQRRLQILESYEVIGRPVVGPTRLSYVPWIQEAVRPYQITRVPSGQPTGLSAPLFTAA